MAILTELGSSRLSAVLGVEHEQVSLAACNLLHVMFDSLKEGMQKDFRGKEDAVVLGECLLPQLADVVQGGPRELCAAAYIAAAPFHGAWINVTLRWGSGAPCPDSMACQPYCDGVRPVCRALTAGIVSPGRFLQGTESIDQGPPGAAISGRGLCSRP